MSKEGSTKIYQGLMLGRGYISHYSEYALSTTLSIYNTLIAIVLREYNAAFLCHWFFLFILWWGSWYATVDFYLFYDSAADMRKRAPLTKIRSQCRVSDTQVTFKALEPLV